MYRCIITIAYMYVWDLGLELLMNWWNKNTLVLLVYLFLIKNILAASMTPSISQTGSPKIWPMIHFLKPLSQVLKQWHTKWSWDMTDRVPCSSRQTRPWHSVSECVLCYWQCARAPPWPALACNTVRNLRVALFHFCSISKIRNILSWNDCFTNNKKLFVLTAVSSEVLKVFVSRWI